MRTGDQCQPATNKFIGLVEFMTTKLKGTRTAETTQHKAAEFPINKSGCQKGIMILFPLTLLPLHESKYDHHNTQLCLECVFTQFNFLIYFQTTAMKIYED